MYYWVIERGGLGWMLPIVSLSVVSLAFFLERGAFWLARRLGRPSRDRILGTLLRDAFERERALGLLSRTGEITLSPHRVFIENLGVADLDTAESRSRDRAEEVVLESRRFLGLQNFIASLSCSLGLLGTVAGVAMAFDKIAFSDPKGLTSALSTAMYTTIAGLFLFFIALTSVTFFGHLSERLQERLEQELHRVREVLVAAAASSRPAGDETSGAASGAAAGEEPLLLV